MPVTFFRHAAPDIDRALELPFSFSAIVTNARGRAADVAAEDDLTDS